MTDELLIEWCMQRYKVDRSIAHDCVEFGPGWWVLKAMIESIIYQRTNGQKPERRTYFPGFPSFEMVGLSFQQSSHLNSLLMALFPVLVKSVKGDKTAKLQVEAIRKIADMQSYKIGKPDIQKFVEVNGADAARSRAFAIRIIMRLIAPYVAPRYSDSNSVLEGTVVLIPYDLVKEGFLPDVYAKVQQHYRKNSTLKSLAVSYHQAELAQMGFRLTLRQLSNDLEEFKDWKPENDEPSIPLAISTYNKQGEFLNQEVLLIGSSSKDWMQHWKVRKASTQKKK